MNASDMTDRQITELLAKERNLPPGSIQAIPVVNPIQYVYKYFWKDELGRHRCDIYDPLHRPEDAIATAEILERSWYISREPDGFTAMIRGFETFAPTLCRALCLAMVEAILAKGEEG